jgi:hypothetical protein
LSNFSRNFKHNTMDSVKKILHIRSKSKSKSHTESEESNFSADSGITHEEGNCAQCPLSPNIHTLTVANSADVLRKSIDSELAAMTPEERKAYLEEFEEAERTGKPKKGSLLEKLIERGNRKTEEQLEREAREREMARR